MKLNCSTVQGLSGLDTFCVSDMSVAISTGTHVVLISILLVLLLPTLKQLYSRAWELYNDRVYQRLHRQHIIHNREEYELLTGSPHAPSVLVA